MTDFVLHSAVAAAEGTIEQRALLVLTARDTQAFVNARRYRLTIARGPGNPSVRPPSPAGNGGVQSGTSARVAIATEGD